MSKPSFYSSCGYLGTTYYEEIEEGLILQTKHGCHVSAGLYLVNPFDDWTGYIWKKDEPPTEEQYRRVISILTCRAIHFGGDKMRQYRIMIEQLKDAIEFHSLKERPPKGLLDKK